MRGLSSLGLLGVMLCAPVPAQDLGPGSRVPDFTVQDLSGQPRKFSELKGEVTVVTFISVQCPVSNAYNDRMTALYRDYNVQGVKFIFINANRTEPPAAVAEHAKGVGFPFPVYKDVNNEVADLFHAQVTPESYVIDKAGIVRYHGAIDDSQNIARVQRKPLRQALDAVLAGTDVTVAETKAFGCTIKRARKTT